MIKQTIFSALALVLSSSAHAASTFNFGAGTNPVGTSRTYTSGSLQVTATGYDANNALTNLYAKNAGGDEIGLGLANDPSGQHEIASGMGYVQLDVSKLFGQASGATFFTGSTSSNETWQLFGSNTAGSLGTALLSGSTEGSFALPDFGTFKYYDFRAAPAGDGRSSSNFLLAGVTVAAVPEPATWAMMLIGFGMMGTGMRSARRRSTRKSDTNVSGVSSAALA